MAEEIQGHPQLNSCLSSYKTFCGYNVSLQDPETVVKDEVQKGQVHVEIDNDQKTNKGSDSYFEFHCGNNKKIKVLIRRPKQVDSKKTEQPFTPTLFLIFDCPNKDNNGDAIDLMDEIIAFAKRTKLPCHIVGQRVLFHSGSSTTASIHFKTDKNTIEELMKKGFNTFERLDETIQEEIPYFTRMAECAIGTDVLPVIISLQTSLNTKETFNKATGLIIPIIHFKKRNKAKTQDINVLLISKYNEENPEGNDNNTPGIIEYKTTNEMPWRVQKVEEINTTWSDGIERISDIPSDLNVLICNIVVGVCVEVSSLTKEQNMLEFENTYLTPLSIYLLKGGNWTIPKKDMKKKLFNQRALDYIYEVVFSKDYMKKRWSQQTSFAKVGYKPPDFNDQNISEPVNTDLKVIGANAKGHTVELTKWESECYGLIFFALLQKQHWDGALQLLANGYIGIHHILFGCVILEDEINQGKAEKLLKEKLKRIQKALTDKAISITSYIHEADKLINKQKKKENSPSSKDKSQICTDNLAEQNLNHAERLLLNHGYLRDAINTENIAYLESGPVKKIIRKTFYGKEKIKRQTTLCFVVLAAVHMIVLPLLMINMEARPLHWFYKKYKLHYMKVYIHMLGFLALLIAYANMLLFDYRVDGITNTDYFIMLWMASFFVDETNQIIVAVIRGKWNNYSIDWWNLLDWLMIVLYTTGMLLKTGEGSGFQITSKLFLVVTFTALCTRLLHLTCMTEFLGRKLVINRKMIKDTSAFMIIITIIMLWYSVSFYALLYPNSDFSWKQMEKILRNGYWMLFGDLNIDATDLECSHNKTIYDRGILQRCPSDLGVYVTPYLKAFYGLLAVVLLLNLLIAMYSDTYTKVQQNANLSWLQMQIDLFEEYRIKTVFPKHLQLLALPGSILAILWFCYYFLRNKYKSKQPDTPEIPETPETQETPDTPANDDRPANDHPMFVRVFLYDTNYDIKFKETDEAEKTGVSRACEDEGQIDLSDSDAITTLNRLKTIEDALQDMREKEDKRNQQVMQLLKEIDKKFQVDKKGLKTKETHEEAIQRTEF